MEKDYGVWMPLKRHLNNNEEPRLFFHEREVWYCHLGENIGFEQDGRGEQFLRPVLIIRKFNNDVCWVVPLTRTKKQSAFYFTFNLRVEDKEVVESSTAILSQIRLIDTKRLRRIIGYISEEDFPTLKKKLKALLP